MFDTPQKQCTGPCGRILPATTEYFHALHTVKCGLNGRCKECRSKERKEQRKENPEATYAYDQSRLEKHREQSQKHKNAHREEYRQAGREYYHAHKEEYKIYREQYDQTHKEEKSKRGKARYYAHIEETRARKRAYRQTHREERKAGTRNYRAKKRNNEGTHTAQDIQAQYQRQKGKCYYCSTKFGTGKNAYHVDHVVPLIRNGLNSPDNLVLACPFCNMSKGKKLLHEWIEGGRLL